MLKGAVMRNRLSVVAVCLCAVLVVSNARSSGSDVVEQIKAARLMLDAAFQNNDVEAIKSMVTPDHVGVTTYYNGSFSAEKEIATLSLFKGRYFDFSETKVDVLGEDAAMITFESSQSGTFDGKPLPSRIFVVEIWTRSSGQWLQKYYQETPIAK
ncbi:MAG: nuclear transport factor 2 family protein [Pseudomonadota bacterium]